MSSMNLNPENGLRGHWPQQLSLEMTHENVGVCRYHFSTHSSDLGLEIMFPVELKVVAFEYEGQKFDQSLCRWVLDFTFLPNLLACLDVILIRNIGDREVRGKWHPWKQGGCRVEMGPWHLASSGNLLCLLSRTADFEHEVADVHQQTLTSYPWDGHWQKLWDGPGCRMFWGGIESTCFRLVNKLFFSFIWPSSWFHWSL